MAITVTVGRKKKDHPESFCGSRIPGGGAGDTWWCNLERGHDGLHEAWGCRDNNFYTWEDEDAAETMMLIALGLKE